MACREHVSTHVPQPVHCAKSTTATTSLVISSKGCIRLPGAPFAGDGSEESLDALSRQHRATVLCLQSEVHAVYCRVNHLYFRERISCRHLFCYSIFPFFSVHLFLIAYLVHMIRLFTAQWKTVNASLQQSVISGLFQPRSFKYTRFVHF